jgi:hypothetical protein
MYFDPIVFYTLWAIATLPMFVCFFMAYIIARGTTRGGLTFCRIGKLGFSFYIRRS